MDVIKYGKTEDEIQSSLLLEAAQEGNEALARILLEEEGANLKAKTRNGQTALHLAVNHSHWQVVRLLVEKGADIEDVDDNGNKPLYLAAGTGNQAMIDLLLQFNANVESLNAENKSTALYESVQNGHIAVAKTLLDGGASIDMKVSDGYTPLFSAVRHGRLEIAELLLQHGANKRMRVNDGRAVEDLAGGDKAMLSLLQAPPLIQGPTISKNESNFRFAHIPCAPGQEQEDELKACHGFEASIVDFHIQGREHRVQMTASVYDVLYGRGPEAIMGSTKNAEMTGDQPSFRWYHLPANNASRLPL
ncbi:Ankyrin repeat-containing protein [Glarea lozoyensis ATCC 20868]|uniref:Ankyrin repeat-containing protein n=1 Tax=Glarea lozoyensis (strain ATCC 20868 / MF5171) TaxID=1116229 RepID=S3DZM4_GLAL2|nr:Ankyrin repeat-containing protein [Glarea lozoyensis ATCC 20868]EPE31753.1 Ankyrin repeat-containing protein [Glarea lozoyensis ATCC 20868]